MSEGKFDAVPIKKGPSGRHHQESDPTFRYNPKTGVGALNATAYRMLGEPTAIGVWYKSTHHRVCLDHESPESGLARKLSKKRTISVTGLREYVSGDYPRKWVIWYSQSDGGWVFNMEDEIRG